MFEELLKWVNKVQLPTIDELLKDYLERSIRCEESYPNKKTD